MVCTPNGGSGQGNGGGEDDAGLVIVFLVIPIVLFIAGIVVIAISTAK